MICPTLIVVVSLSVCGLLVLRHAVRTAPLLSARSGQPAPRRPAYTDRHRRNLEPDPRTDLTLDLTTKHKLRREELRQRPWEGRN